MNTDNYREEYELDLDIEVLDQMIQKGLAANSNTAPEEKDVQKLGKTTSDNIVDSLADLSIAELNMDITEQHKKLKINGFLRRILDDEQMEELEQIIKSMDEEIVKAKNHKSFVENQVKQLALIYGKSVVGNGESDYDAIYNKGRENYDAKLLDGYAVAHPEILAMKKIGEPYVSIRKKKEKK